MVIVTACFSPEWARGTPPPKHSIAADDSSNVWTTVARTPLLSFAAARIGPLRPRPHAVLWSLHFSVSRGLKSHVSSFLEASKSMSRLPRVGGPREVIFLSPKENRLYRRSLPKRFIYLTSIGDRLYWRSPTKLRRRTTRMRRQSRQAYTPSFDLVAKLMARRQRWLERMRCEDGPPQWYTCRCGRAPTGPSWRIRP
jgi:hypothetical protein